MAERKAAGAAALGAVVGGMLEGLYPAGGLWLFGLSLAGAGMGSSRPGEERHDAAMGSMSCATLGGFAGGLVAYVLSHAILGPEAAHGVHALGAPVSHGNPAPSVEHLAVLGMYFMNAAMGAMVGASLPGCPKLGRLFALRLTLPGLLRPALKGPR